MPNFVNIKIRKIMFDQNRDNAPLKSNMKWHFTI